MGSKIEKMIYEARPYLYAFIALFAFYNFQVSKLMVLSGALLAYCSYAVFSMRREYRRHLVAEKSNRKHNE